MDTNPVLIFRPRQGNTFKLIFLGLLFVVAGISLVYMGNVTLGWIMIIIFGLALIAGVIRALPGATFIRLNKSGVENRFMFRSWFIDWKEIQQFGYGSSSGTQMIVYKLNPDSPKKGKAWTKINSSLAGADGGFDTLGHSAEEMVKVFNEWKEKYAFKEVRK